MNALFREQFARSCRAEAQKKKKKDDDDDDGRGTFTYHQLTILAQHAYALSLGATVLKDEEEEKELKPVQRRTYVAVPEERITTRFDIVLQACDWTKRGGGEKKNSSRKFVTFATFREETYSSSSGGNGGKIFDAKKAFGDGVEKRGEEDFLRDKSDIEVHELFSESMFDPIYRAYAEAVATVPNRREPPSLRATPKELLERIFTKVRGVDLCALDGDV